MKKLFGFLVAATVASQASVASGQTTTDAPAEPEEEARPLEVVVRGRRPGMRGTNVEKLDKRTLERSGATSVAEGLERLPSAMSASGARGERIVSLRGFDQRQIQVTMDGVPIQVPYDGQLDLGKFPLGLVDHITVVKGAGSLLFGPNGLGGAINIASRRPGEGPTVVLASETAPFHAQRMSGLGTGRAGSVAILGGAAFENVRYVPMPNSYRPTINEDGGRRDNSDRTSLSAVGKASWEIDDRNEVIASVWHLDGTFGVPPGVHDLTRRFWRWTDWHVNTYALAHGFRDGSLTVDETAYYSLVGNTLDVYDDARYAAQALPSSGTSVYDDRTLGANARAAYRLSCEQGACVTARGWVGAKKDWHGSQAGTGEPSIDVDTTTLTGAAQLDGPLGERMLWLAGTQLDVELPGRGVGAIRPDPAVGMGPMGAYTWQPFGALDLTASVAHRTRFPTLKERFSAAFGGLEPNPSLAPERATNLGLDARWRASDKVRLDVGAFDSELRDLVIKVPVSTQTQQWQNAGRARFMGVEASLRAKPFEWFEVWAGWAAMRARRLDEAPPEDVVPYRPGQKATLMLTVVPVAEVALSAEGRYVGTQRFQNPDTLQFGTLGAYQVFDARVEARAFRGLRLWVRGTNLTDVHAQGRYSFPEPGRQLFVGASSTLSRAAE